ncbi:CaiB/BaiF CoA transferase family protein [Klebsiella variicola]|uniref:CaiB/BaiF CoA transferase family protein n=1 Tax=Klebsiella variicola TaxID=244366 RepID=UPI001C23212A|nr:CaiB/BaiF CoA-transferase family protein [Klebsiella variicola]MBU9731537.1 CoA transferase [Klebsiella variicola]
MLEGVRIISLCHWLQGPAGAQYLADMGAEVIKVEPIGGAHERRWSGANVFVNEVSGFYLCANKNKQSICLDLKSAEGRDTLLRLIASADVLMENFRPGTLDRLGLSYETLKEVKPDLIYASASGYGADGPYAKLPGQDLLIQARTGLIAATAGQKPGVLPAAAGCAVIDQHGAALFALGILGALVHKQKTGEGTRVESSLFSAAIDLQQEAITNYFNGDKTPEVYDRDPHLATWFHEGPYGIYETSDHRFIAMSLNPLALIEKAIGPSELATDGTLDAYANRDAIAADVARRIAKFTFSELQSALDEHKVWYAPVNNYSELATDPQAIHNQAFQKKHVSGKEAVLVSHPNRYNGQVLGIRHIAEHPGVDTPNVLKSSGFTDEEIASLLEKGVVG